MVETSRQGLARILSNHPEGRAGQGSLRCMAVLLLCIVMSSTGLAQDAAQNAGQNAGQEDGWDDDGWGDDWDGENSAGLVWTGFLEGGVGSRWKSDPQVGRKGTLQDLRVRAKTEWVGDSLSAGFIGELLLDGIADEVDVEIRDLTLSFSPTDRLDTKLGRQVLTWGTGDLLFLNDLFPKDWVSFFAGRDDEYLKAPSNTARLTFYGGLANIDFAWTPDFEPDTYLTGERFSFFSPAAGDLVAPDPPLNGIEPDGGFGNGEFAVRVFRTIRGVEYALYGYRGFFKQPTALTPERQPTFSRMTAFGGSVRRSWGPGLINSEFAQYISRDDRNGTNPLIPNSQLRFLLGYEWELMTNLTAGVQYYLEWTRDYSELVANSPFPQFEPDQYRHLVTTRLSYRAWQDKLVATIFVFYSPSDSDYYLLPKLTYRYSDQWSFTAGLNLFGGRKIQTFFGQFEDNGNVYARVRYHY